MQIGTQQLISYWEGTKIPHHPQTIVAIIVKNEGKEKKKKKGLVLLIKDMFINIKKKQVHQKAYPHNGTFIFHSDVIIFLFYYTWGKLVWLR